MSVSAEDEKRIDAEQDHVGNAVPEPASDVPASGDLKDTTPTPDGSVHPNPVAEAGIIDEEDKSSAADTDEPALHIIPRGSLNKPSVVQPKPRPKPR